MFRVFYLLGASILFGCEQQAVSHRAIVGTWKSNAERTLESMNSVEGVTPKAREYLEKDFFGHLVNEIREHDSRSFDARGGFDSGYEPYEVLEVTDKYIRAKQWSSLLQEFQERTLYIENECYYVLITKFQFREYFCKVSP